VRHVTFGVLRKQQSFAYQAFHRFFVAADIIRMGAVTLFEREQFWKCRADAQEVRVTCIDAGN